MSRTPIVLGLVLVACIVAGVGFLLGGDPPEIPEPEATRSRSDQPTVPRRPASPPPRPEPEAIPKVRPDPAGDVDALDDALLAVWEDALDLHRDGDPVSALARLAPHRREEPAFFEDPERAAVLAKMEDAALLALDRLTEDGRALAAERLGAMLKLLILDPARLGVLASRQDTTTTVVDRTARGQESRVVGRARTAKEKAALRRHLSRFGRGGTRSRGRDPLAPRLKAVADLSTEPVEELPVPDPDEAEKRRLDQLEKLRRRNAVELLDHIASGLAWLALHQGEDGQITDAAAKARCKAMGHTAACVKPSSRSYPVAATALAIMAFLDFRDQDTEGLFEPTLARATTWLLAQQGEDGAFPAPRGYSHAIAVMALGQAAAATGRGDIRSAAARGLAYLDGIAGPGGGFRYRPRTPGDLSVTGWVAQAVETTRAANIGPSAALIANLDRFRAAAALGNGSYVYLVGGAAKDSLAPVGMLTDHVLGGDSVPAVDRAAWRAALRQRRGRPSLYTLYYGVRILLAMDGALPENWNGWVKDLAGAQVTKGAAAGQFDGRKRWRLNGGGRTVLTAFSLLTLEHSLYRR